MINMVRKLKRPREENYMDPLMNLKYERRKDGQKTALENCNQAFKNSQKRSRGFAK